MSGILTVVTKAVEKSGERAWRVAGVSSFRVRALSQIGLCLLSAGCFNAALAAETSNPWRLSSEEQEKTIISLKKHWAREPGISGVAIELSSLLLMQGRREEAVRTLLSTHAVASSEKERLRLESRVKVVSRSFVTVEGARDYQAGVNALLSGDLKVALSRFEKVLAAERDVLDALVRKGQVEVLLGRPDSAAESFRAARSLSPFESEIRLWLGHVLLTRGEKEEGVREVLLAWKLSGPEQQARPHWRAWVAEAYFISGRGGAARKVLEGFSGPDAARWGPTSGWALWALRRIDPSTHAQAKKFLNLFPSGYRRLTGSAGLDLEWWEPQLLEADPNVSILGEKNQ